jgi:hypothetical protein
MVGFCSSTLSIKPFVPRRVPTNGFDIQAAGQKDCVTNESPRFPRLRKVAPPERRLRAKGPWRF